jgi:hypothetical protein
MEKLIAYQTVDREGDIWCNTALLFKDEEAVNKFFSNPQLVIDTLGLEVNEDEDINDCIKVYRYGHGVNERVASVEINLEYCGKKVIKQLSGGFLIE